MGRLRFELRTNRLKAALEYPEGAAIAVFICGWYEESTADNIRQLRTGSAITATARDVRHPAYGWAVEPAVSEFPDLPPSRKLAQTRCSDWLLPGCSACSCLFPVVRSCRSRSALIISGKPHCCSKQDCLPGLSRASEYEQLPLAPTRFLRQGEAGRRRMYLPNQGPV